MINLLSSGRGLLVIGLTAYLLFALISLPAPLAIAWFVPDEIKTSRVSGTAWSGHADTIVMPGVTLTDTEWRFRPLSLLSAKLSYKVSTMIGGGVIDTQVSISPSGTIVLSKTAGVLPLGYFPPIAPSVTLDGKIGLNFEELLIQDQWVVDAQGTVDIVGLRLVTPVAESLGNYEVVFSGAGESSLDGLISEVDGPLDVNGTLFLYNDKKWQATGNVKPTSTASTQLVQGLGFIGTRNPDGSYTLSYPDSGQ